MKPKVYFPFSAKARRDFWHDETLARLAAACELVGMPDGATDPWAHIPDDAVAVVTGWGVDRKMPAEACRAASGLKAIAVFGGSPAVIEAPEEAVERGIAIISASQAIADGVAEMTLGLMLASLYGLVDSAAAYRETGQIKVNALSRSGSLSGATVGMVGFGYVGRRVADCLRAFGPRLYVHDPFADAARIESHGGRAGALDEVLAGSDVITIHAAWTPQTHGMLNRERLGLIRPGTLVVSTARMPLFDEEALAEMIEAGAIRFATDFVPFNAGVWGRPRVHRRSNLIGIPGHTSITARGVRAMGELVAGELERLVGGQALAHSMSAEWIRHTTSMMPAKH